IDYRRDTVNHHAYSFTAVPFPAGGAVDTIAWRVDNSYAGMGDSLVRTLTNGSHTVCVTLFTSTGCRADNCLTVQVGDSTDPVPSPPAPPPAIDSNASVIDSASAAAGFIRSYPNPATTQAGVEVTLTQPATIYIHVYNSMGSPVINTTVSGYQGVNHLQVPLGNLQTGVYYLQVQYGNTVKRSKIQKL
ncbi:MAG TPA: T9SS type A sorting domain-containing protein, partial [Puia sp.]|nr:T9SS type A sorting domain-containing protein [Puia sp.]